MAPRMEPEASVSLASPPAALLGQFLTDHKKGVCKPRGRSFDRGKHVSKSFGGNKTEPYFQFPQRRLSHCTHKHEKNSKQLHVAHISSWKHCKKKKTAKGGEAVNLKVNKLREVNSGS